MASMTSLRAPATSRAAHTTTAASITRSDNTPEDDPTSPRGQEGGERGTEHHQGHQCLEAPLCAHQEHNAGETAEHEEHRPQLEERVGLPVSPRDDDVRRQKHRATDEARDDLRG